MLPRICYQLRFSNKNNRNLMIIRIGEITCGCTKERFLPLFFHFYVLYKTTTVYEICGYFVQSNNNVF